MSLLSDAEMAACRSLAEEAMPSTCTIQTRTETNTKGSVALSYVNTYTNVKCRIMPANRTSGEYIGGIKITAEAEYILTVPYNQTLTAKDRIVYGGKTYEVMRVHAEHDYRTAVRAELVLVDGGV